MPRSFRAWNRKTKKPYTPGGKRVFGPRALEWLKRTRGTNVVYRAVSKPQTRAERIVAVARREIGVVEVPKDSNTGPRVIQYQRTTTVPGTGWPWCMAFVTWVCKQAGCPLGYRGAYVPDFVKWAKATGRFRYVPHVGDAVIFEFNGDTIVDHVGIVEKIDYKGFTSPVHTPHIGSIEGNTSPGADGSQSNGGGVYRRQRDKVLVKGYVRLT